MATSIRHCGQDMGIVKARMKCLACGFEMPTPGQEGIRDQPIMHCGINMLVVRDLQCDLCGYQTTHAIHLESSSAPASDATSKTAGRKRAVTQPLDVTSLAGKAWGRYRIISQLGRGGMAIVYKALQPGLERHVAIKFLLEQAGSDATLMERFKQEAQLIARLHHPNIVTVLDFGERQGVAYLVMEYVEGETLRARLGKPMALEPALEIAGQVGRALDYAHSQGIVHRDVKPSNVLMARENWALLSDFGIAKAMEAPSHLTQTGIGLGTPEYMAPEQAKGLKVDTRCDIYALGVVLYEMLTGRPPFTAETPLTVMLKHCTEPLPSPRAINGSIPEAVEQVVMKATAKEPGERYASVREMVAALESLGATKREQTVAPSPDAPTVVEVERIDLVAPVEGQGSPSGQRRFRWWPF